LDNIELPVIYNEIPWPEKKRVREAYIKQQNGLCYHCHHPLDGEPSDEMKAMTVTPRLYPDTFFKFPIHLHHSHETGLTIGVVHNRCNAILWEHHNE
jgi:hypothetical protein